MLIDADLAGGYWCPFGEGRKAYEEGDDTGCCEGSSCAAWRWANDDPDDTMGYCGLAGVPLQLRKRCKVKDV